MTTGKLHQIRLIALVMLFPLLSSCSAIHTITQPGARTGTGTAQAAADADTDAPAAAITDSDGDDDDTPAAEATKIIPASQEINLASSIEKNHLSISYSLKSIHGKHEDLLRLTLIFKNLADKERHIWPHVDLLDAQDKTVRAYSLKTFLQTLSPPPHAARGSKAGRQAAPALNEWADMYWLKHSYRIPPHGIAIGELVYHGKQFGFPLKLNVRIYKDYFRFTAQRP